MKLKLLYAENFRTISGYQELPLTDETINLFVGETNGVGKSSWFFLLYYLLTGYVAGKTQDEYVNWDSTEMSCGVEFEYRNSEFKIEAEYKVGSGKSPGKADKNLWINGEEFNGVTACNKKLKEYFEPNLFIAATGLFQDAKTFTSSKDSERRDILKKVFNLDYADDIKELEKEEKAIEASELQPQEKKLIELKGKKFIEQKVLEQPVSIAEYNKYRNELNSANEEKAKVDLSLSSIDEKNKAKNTKQSLLDSKNLSLERENKSLLSIQNAIDDAESFQQDFSKLEKMQSDLTSIKLERIKQFDETKLNDFIQQVSNNLAEMKALEKTINDCKSGKCPVCGDAFNASKHEQYQTKVDALNTLNIELQKEIVILKKEKLDYENLVRQNESRKRDKELLESKINSEQNRLATELLSNEEKLTTQKNSLSLKNNAIYSLCQDIDNLHKELESIIVEDATELKSQIFDLSKVIIDLTSKIKQYESIEAQNTLIEQQNKQLIIDREENEKSILQVQLKIDELVEKKQQFSKMRAFLKNEFPSYVISSMIESIQNDMNEFISKVYYKDLDVEINGDDDNIDVLYGTGQRKVDAVNASGAEKALLALSYCYALNKFKDYGILFIDEVDSALKNDASVKLAEMIDSVKAEYDFIGIVSHVSSVQDFYYAKGSNIIEVGK